MESQTNWRARGRCVFHLHGEALERCGLYAISVLTGALAWLGYVQEKLRRTLNERVITILEKHYPHFVKNYASYTEEELKRTVTVLL